MPRRALEIVRRHLLRAGLQPPARDHPPRHQAGQRHAHPDRPGQGDGLRHRPGAGQRREHDDADVRRDRHRPVPLAGAGARRGGRRPQRRLRHRLRDLRAAHRAPAVRRRQPGAAWRTSTSGRIRGRRASPTRDVTPDIDAVVLKALAKNPANRYQSAGEMRADLLRAAAGRPVSAPPVMTEAERTAMMAPPPRTIEPAAAAGGPGGAEPAARAAEARQHGARRADHGARHARARRAGSRPVPGQPVEGRRRCPT